MKIVSAYGIATSNKGGLLVASRARRCSHGVARCVARQERRARHTLKGVRATSHVHVGQPPHQVPNRAASPVPELHGAMGATSGPSSAFLFSALW